MLKLKIIAQIWQFAVFWFKFSNFYVKSDRYLLILSFTLILKATLCKFKSSYINIEYLFDYKWVFSIIISYFFCLFWQIIPRFKFHLNFDSYVYKHKLDYVKIESCSINLTFGNKLCSYLSHICQFDVKFDR